MVEIKKPGARPTGPCYRGSGGAEVHPPHHDLTSAVAQRQAQIESAQVHLPQLVAQTPGLNSLDTCVVQGAVIVGMAGSLTTEEQRSFLRYRNGLQVPRSSLSTKSSTA
ncbi:hypothetical protein ACQPXM_25160 [Kribbella sp. CA-253562]|uniref:hypothetical protein n=1 Tax=Kribbella sp. CA-253562 TaxID=3239942 RepID=UPI003D8B6408